MRIKIEFEIKLDTDGIEYTKRDVHEFLRYAFRDTGSIPMSNPFVDAEEPEPIDFTFEWREL